VRSGADRPFFFGPKPSPAIPGRGWQRAPTCSSRFAQRSAASTRFSRYKSALSAGARGAGSQLRLVACSTACCAALTNPDPPLSRCQPGCPRADRSHCLPFGLARQLPAKLCRGSPCVGRNYDSRDSFICRTRARGVVERTRRPAGLDLREICPTLFRETSTLPGVRYGKRSLR